MFQTVMLNISHVHLIEKIVFKRSVEYKKMMKVRKREINWGWDSGGNLAKSLQLKCKRYILLIHLKSQQLSQSALKIHNSIRFFRFEYKKYHSNRFIYVLERSALQYKISKDKIDVVKSHMKAAYIITKNIGYLGRKT